MANIKISELIELISIETGDVFPIVDVNDPTQSAEGSTKKVTINNLESYLNSNLSFLSSGDNVSELTNDSGYVTSNITHTGEVTGLGTLSMNSTAITNKTTVTGVSGDFVLISDTSDAGNLKKVDVVDFLGGGGDSIYTASGNVFAGAVATMSDAAGLTFKGFDDLSTSEVVTFRNSSNVDLFNVSNNGSLTTDYQGSSNIFQFKNLGNSRLKQDNGGVITQTVAFGNNTDAFILKNSGAINVFTVTGDGRIETRVGATIVNKIGSNNNTYFDSTGANKFIVGSNTVLGTEDISLQGTTRIGGDTQIDGALTINTTTPSVIGQVWTATGTAGEGAWQAAAGGGDGNGIYDGSGSTTGDVLVTLGGTNGLILKGTGVGATSRTLVGQNSSGTELYEFNNEGKLTLDYQGGLSILNLKGSGASRFSFDASGILTQRTTFTNNTVAYNLENSTAATIFEVTATGRTKIGDQTGNHHKFDDGTPSYINSTGAAAFIVGATTQLGSEDISLQGTTRIGGDTQIDGDLLVNNSTAGGSTFKGFDDINNTLIRGENNTGTQIFEINNRGGLSIDHQIASGQILDLDNLGSARYQLGSDGQVNWWSTGTSTKYKVSSGAKVREDKEAGGFDFFDGALNTQIRIHPTADNWFSGTGVTKFLVGGTSSLGGQLIQLQDDTYIVGDTQIDGDCVVNGTDVIFRPPVMTTTQRDALTAVAGDTIYNSTTNKHQGYNGTIWNDFY